MSAVSWTCGIKFDDKKSLGEYIQTSTTPEKQHNNAVIMHMHTCWAAIIIWQGAIDKHPSPGQVLRICPCLHGRLGHAQLQGVIRLVQS